MVCAGRETLRRRGSVTRSFGTAHGSGRPTIPLSSVTRGRTLQVRQSSHAPGSARAVCCKESELSAAPEESAVFSPTGQASSASSRRSSAPRLVRRMCHPSSKRYFPRSSRGRCRRPRRGRCFEGSRSILRSGGTSVLSALMEPRLRLSGARLVGLSCWPPFVSPYSCTLTG